jgi:hypothetical protein
MIIEKLKALLQCYAGTNEPAPLAAGVAHYNMFNEECGAGMWHSDCNCGLFNCDCDCDCSSDCDDDDDCDDDCEYDPYVTR